MRFFISSAIVGVAALATLAASTASFAVELETCKSVATTVWVTVPAVSTVTVHDSPISTGYLTAPYYAPGEVTGLPTTTLTRFYTSTHTNTASASASLSTLATDDDQTSTAKVTYETTITTTVPVETVYLTYISTPVSTDGRLSFMVSDGTTYWAGGVAPPTTASYVVVTSAVTVVPVITPIYTNNMHTRSTTIHTTIVSGHRTTVTKTLPGHNVTVTLVYVSKSAGSAIPFTGLASGGWNASSGFAYVISKQTSSNGLPVFITEQSSYDLYGSRSSEHLTASAAKSGFAALSSYPASLTSTAEGVVTTALSSRQNMASGYGGSTTTSCTDSATITPYGNLTTGLNMVGSLTTALTIPLSTGSAADSPSNSTFSLLISSTHSANGVFTSPVIGLNSTSCSESAISSSSSEVLINTRFSSAAFFTTTNTSSFTFSTVDLLSTSAYSADGTATSKILPTNNTYAASTANSTGLSSSTTSTGAGIITTSVPSSFVTIYSSSSSLFDNSTSTIGTVESSSSEIVSSATYNYAAGSPSSISGSSSSNTTGGLASPTGSLLENATASYAADPQPSSSSVLTSGTLEVVSTSGSTSAVSITKSVIDVTSSSGSLSSVDATSSEPSTVTSLLNSQSVTFSSLTTSTSPSYPIDTTSVSQTSTSTSSSASATPTSCGETGDFTLNFDDIPPLVATNDTFNTIQPAPVFNPYHQFDFSDGFTVVPPPRDPYLPSSKPLLTEFIPNFNVLGNNTQSGPNTKEYGFSGEVGNGDHGLTGCFSFNFYGAAFGCDSRGPDCDFTFTSYRYDRDTKLTNQVAQQGYVVPACLSLSDCSLTPVKFTNEFLNIDSIRINVTVAAEPKIWWMDDLQLGWFNNTCAAGLCRISTHIH